METKNNMKRILLGCMPVVVGAAYLLPAMAGAQTAMPVAQVIGSQNTQNLQYALSLLVTTLNQLSAALGDPNRSLNLAAVGSDLGAIGGSLININSTIAVLDDRARTLAASGVFTPGLPNTGGGAAR